MDWLVSGAPGAALRVTASTPRAGRAIADVVRGEDGGRLTVTAHHDRAGKAEQEILLGV